MGLFNRKSKISIEEVCREFYDTQIFQPAIGDFPSVFWQTVFKSITEADCSFATIDSTLFQQEMTALRIELFGLAWMHKFKQERYTIPQSNYTRRYLEENGKSEVWEIMGEYNQAIADSTTLTASGEQMEEWQVTKANKARADMFYKWAEANIRNPSATTTEEDKLANCIAHVANRIDSDIRRNDGILIKRLTARLAFRLGCDPNLNTEALFRLGAVIFGLYEGAMEAIKSVKLQ